MATYGLKSITVDGNTYEMNTKNALGISLNGGSLSFDGSTANQSVSFYAPTTAGTDGYFLKSNGSGAPTWEEVDSASGWGVVAYDETTQYEFDELMAQYDSKLLCWISGENQENYFLPLSEIEETGAEAHQQVSRHVDNLGQGTHVWTVNSTNFPLDSTYPLTLTIIFYYYNNSQTVTHDFTPGVNSSYTVNVFGASITLAFSNDQTINITNNSSTVFNLDATADFYLDVSQSPPYFNYIFSGMIQNKAVSVKAIESADGMDFSWDSDISINYYIDNITLNGSTTTTPSFYAPTTAGTSGYYLKSNGSGAPTWAQIPAGVTVTLNGSATTTPSFYAPTEAGTVFAPILTWNATLNRPSWTSGSLTDTKVTVAENTMATKYYPILATGTGTATRQIDTDDQVDSSADAVGLWYQNGILCAPALQVGDVDYAITTAEYEALMDAIDAI